MVIAIVNAEYTEAYKIRFSFDDGTVKEVDFGPFLNKQHNPMTRQFLDLNKFRDFKLEYGDIMWGDFEMCFPIWDLYEGRV